MKLPKAKAENIVVQNVNDETLIYNLTTNQAFCLNETSAKVFNACDGKQTFADLKAKYNFTDDLIYLTLDELKDKNLVEDYQSKFAGVSRREVIKKVGLASMIALPVVAGIIAPTAAMAASGCINPNGAPAGRPAGNFGCGQSNATDCAVLCNANANVRSQCCSGNVTANAGGSCGLMSCCICA